MNDTRLSKVLQDASGTSRLGIVSVQEKLPLQRRVHLAWLRRLESLNRKRKERESQVTRNTRAYGGQTPFSSSLICVQLSNEYFPAIRRSINSSSTEAIVYKHCVTIRSATSDDALILRSARIILTSEVPKTSGRLLGSLPFSFCFN